MPRGRKPAIDSASPDKKPAGGKKFTEEKLPDKKLLEIDAMLQADPSLLRRSRPRPEPEPEPVPLPVSAGPVDRVVDLVFNPAEDKILEMTNLDRIQARLLPSLGILDLAWQHVIEVAAYRQDSTTYRKAYKKEFPVEVNLVGRFMHLTAQAQKSVGGQNMKSAVELALAEMDRTKEEDFPGGHGYED